MNMIKTTFVTVLILSANTLNAADKMRVIDRGLDGEQRQYEVFCPNGNTGSVTKYFEFDLPDIDPDELSRKRNAGSYIPSSAKANKAKLVKVCVNDEAQCKTSWDIEDAVKVSCSL